MKPESFVFSTNSYNYKGKKIAPEAPEGDIGAFFYIYFTFLSQISFNSMILHSFMEISKSVSGQHSSAILPGVIIIMSVDMTQRGAVRDHQKVRAMEIRRGLGDLPQLDRPLQQLEAFPAFETF